MESTEGASGAATAEPKGRNAPPQQAGARWRRFLGGKSTEGQNVEERASYRSKSTLGILSDKQTDEVPGK